MTMSKFLLGMSLASAVFGAHASVSYNATGGMTSAQPVTATVTFDSGLPGGFATYDNPAAVIAYPGNSGYAAEPPGDLTAFFSVGTTHSQPSSSSVTFGGYGVSYFGFYMGSPDNYNSVDLYAGATHLATITGAQMAAAATVSPDGNQGVGFYMNIFSSTAITKVTFSSTQDAFESDNHSYIAAVPEPETYAMLLAGLGLVAAVARRRKP